MEILVGLLDFISLRNCGLELFVGKGSALADSEITLKESSLGVVRALPNKYFKSDSSC